MLPSSRVLPRGKTGVGRAAPRFALLLTVPFGGIRPDVARRSRAVDIRAAGCLAVAARIDHVAPATATWPPSCAPPPNCVAGTNPRLAPTPPLPSPAEAAASSAATTESSSGSGTGLATQPGIETTAELSPATDAEATAQTGTCHRMRPHQHRIRHQVGIETAGPTQHHRQVQHQLPHRPDHQTSIEAPPSSSAATDTEPCRPDPCPGRHRTDRQRLHLRRTSAPRLASEAAAQFRATTEAQAGPEINPGLRAQSGIESTADLSVTTQAQPVPTPTALWPPTRRHPEARTQSGAGPSPSAPAIAEPPSRPICAAWSVTILAPTRAARTYRRETELVGHRLLQSGDRVRRGQLAERTAVAATDCSCCGSRRPTAGVGVLTNACAAFSSRNRSRMNYRDGVHSEPLVECSLVGPVIDCHGMDSLPLPGRGALLGCGPAGCCNPR